MKQYHKGLFLIGVSIVICGIPGGYAQKPTGVAAFEDSDSPLGPVIENADMLMEAKIESIDAKPEAPESFLEGKPLAIQQEAIPTDLMMLGIRTYEAAAEVDVLMEEHTMLQTFKQEELLVDEGILETLQSAETGEARPEDMAALKKSHFEQKQEMISFHKSEVQEVIQEQKTELNGLIEELKSERPDELLPGELETGENAAAPGEESESEEEKAARNEETAQLRDEVRAIVRTSIANIKTLRESYMIQWEDALRQRRDAFLSAKEEHEIEIRAAKENADPEERRALIKIANDDFRKIVTDVRHDFRQAALAFQHEFKNAAKDIGDTSRKRIKDRREQLRKMRLQSKDGSA